MRCSARFRALLMMMAHRAGQYATTVMVAGALMTGFTALSTATAFESTSPNSSRQRCAGAGTSLASRSGASFRGVTAPFLMVPHTGSAVDLFWHDPRHGYDRRIHPAAVRPRDCGPTRNRYRKLPGARLICIWANTRSQTAVSSPATGLAQSGACSRRTRPPGKALCGKVTERGRMV